MIRKLDVFIPNFLKKIDKKLLLNNPGVWSTKVHFVFFYVLAGISFSTLIAMLQVDINSLSSPEAHGAFMFIPAGIGLVFWLFRVVKFNVERAFGMSSGIEMLKKQFIYALCILMFASLPFYYGYMVGFFNANVIETHELTEDINTVNLAFANLTMKSNQSAPHYDNWTPVGYIYSVKDDVIKGKDLYIKWNRMSHRQRTELIDSYQQVLAKYSDYSYEAINSDDLIYQYQQERNFGDIYAHRYFPETKNAIEDINRGKRMFENNFNYRSEEISIILFLTFLGWLATMIALRTNRKHSITAIVAGIFLIFAGGILGGLSVVLSNGNPGAVIGILFFVTLFILLLQAFSAHNSRRANFWKSVGLVLAVVMTPFVFIVWGTMGSDHPGTEFVSYSGIILTIIMWNLVYSKQFIALKSAPSQD